MVEDTIQRGELTRSAITFAAHHLFLKRGYHGTSMRQIAEKAGISLGGIYNHFSSKDDIFRAVMLEHHPFFSVLPGMETATGDTVEEYVKDAAARMVAALGDRMDYLNLMFIELVEFDGKHLPELFQAFFPKVMFFSDQLVQREGPLRPIPPPVLIRAFIGLFLSFVITELLIGKYLPPDQSQGALDYFIDIYLHGILSTSHPLPNSAA